MKDNKIKLSDCVPYENFLLLPRHLKRLKEIIHMREALDPNRRLPAIQTKQS